MTLDHEQRADDTPRWLHRWAVLTVCVALVVLSLGALVTTRRVGMADPIWPTYPWHLLLIDWQEPTPGFLIEHSHRAAGYTIGICAIVLAAGLWFGQPRRWLGVLGIAFLLAVIVQGLLGGFRVLLHEWLGQHLSLIHGFFAQLVFALAVSLAVFTSAGWRHADARVSLRLRRLSLITVGLLLGQLLLGGFVRHTYAPLGQRGHLLNAFLVVGAVVALMRMTREDGAAGRPLRQAAHLLVGLLGVQVAIGVEAWMTRLVNMSLTGQVFIRTAHFVVGAAVFGAAVATALYANRRRLAAPVVPRRVAQRELEAVA